MRILQIAPPWIATPPSGYGGTELVIHNLCRGLFELGHDVTLFATKNSSSPGELDFVFNRGLVEMDIDWSASLPPLVHYHQAFHEADQYDIVHAHLSSGTDLVILPFLSDLAHKGKAAVMTIHGHWPYDRNSYMDPYFKRLYAKDIAAISISRAMQKLLPKEFRDIGYIHNSLDLNTLSFRARPGRYTNTSSSASRARGNNEGYLAWLGKILPDKGTHEAILAAKEAGERLVLGGIVEKYDKRSVEYFETKVKPLIDDDQIVYIGPLDLKAKNKLLGGAKAFLNPIAWEEPFGMVMIESMACGTPVISYNRGAAPEIIRHGKNGFLVKSRKEMVKAIAIIDTIKRKDCRKYVEEKFSPVAAARKHIEIYQKEITKADIGQRKNLARVVG
ncbi:MAG TPA: glycosyltransferase family 4 protein [Roseiflexaceae bacterium]|nr:glycosyltransferase family 4 protein [Roseiflexaceae bacterium]